MRSLEGQVALVTGGGSAVGRAVALALAARGVRIVVTGRDEKALGITVGEVVHGGGKARHVAGDVRDAAHLAASVERALELFGRLDIVVAGDVLDVECTFRDVPSRMGAGGRLLCAVETEGTDHRAVVEMVRRAAMELAVRRITSNAIVVAAPVDDLAAEAAELAVFLCTGPAHAITGQAITVGHAVRTHAES